MTTPAECYGDTLKANLDNGVPERDAISLAWFSALLAIHESSDIDLDSLPKYEMRPSGWFRKPRYIGDVSGLIDDAIAVHSGEVR